MENIKNFQYQEKNCRLRDVGLIGYQDAYELQKCALKEVIAGQDAMLFMCEHVPVLTMGRMSNESNLLCSREELAEKGIEIFNIDRGGDVTLHSPGQLVVYPILNLSYYKRDLKFYLNKLEQVAIDLLHDFDILADRMPGQTGVFAGEQKIVSIGIGVKKWVTYHGLSININTNLKLFNLIKPCGLDVRMTSMRELKGQVMDFNLIKMKLLIYFSKEFQLNIKV